LSVAKNAVLSDVLSQYPELIPIVNRFGIYLGVGDKSIEKICSERNISEDFLLTVLNVYLDEDYVPDDTLPRLDAGMVADYFHRTIENYIRELVPNIEKHFNALIAMSGSDNKELSLLRQVFMRFKDELESHLKNSLDSEFAYPHELLHDLKNILIKHVSGEFNQNLCYAVVFSITSLEKDLAIHNRLRKKVLLPKLKEMDLSDIKQLNCFISDDKQLHPAANGALLSRREKEILILIAQGRLNKEIAELLHISLNTVLTHRKNIISKTGIKTVSGLTFYCIQHGLIASVN
jgi:DNA-binding CsgD family transcriptional regulator